jgi:hypothetical protein
MWRYLGSSCPDHPFSTELDSTEINTQIRGVLARGADLIFSSGLVPLSEGVDSLWVSLLELTFVYLCQFLFFNAHAHHAHNEQQQARRQRRWAQSAAREAARAQGQETPSEPKSSGDGDEEEDEDKEEG